MAEQERVMGRTKADSVELDEDGIRDALTYFATATSGAYYVVPPVEALRGFASADD